MPATSENALFSVRDTAKPSKRFRTILPASANSMTDIIQDRPVVAWPQTSPVYILPKQELGMYPETVSSYELDFAQPEQQLMQERKHHVNLTKKDTISASATQHLLQQQQNSFAPFRSASEESDSSFASYEIAAPAAAPSPPTTPPSAWPMALFSSYDSPESEFSAYSPASEDDLKMMYQNSSSMSPYSSTTDGDDLFEIPNAMTPDDSTFAAAEPQQPNKDWSISLSETGISIDTNVQSITELYHQLVERLNLDDSETVPPTKKDDYAEKDSRALLSKNKAYHTKPINYQMRVYFLGGDMMRHNSQLNQGLLIGHVADHCVNVFFSCWSRNFPVMHKPHFMAWYENLKQPTDEVIVNAICASVARHVLVRHANSTLNLDIAKIRELEEHFFEKARDGLGSSFDEPNRHHVVALCLMSACAGKDKKAYYNSMAVRTFYDLGVKPRLVTDDDDSFERELDTRLWWYLWALDFYLYAAGASSAPVKCPVAGEIDLPRVCEEDIDIAEIGVLNWTHELELWKIQSDITERLYVQKHEITTAEELTEFENRLNTWRDSLPRYFQLDSGFEYGCTDLFQACLQIHVEFNATWIILHKLFIPNADATPTPSSLHSLNMCLNSSLLILKLLDSIERLPGGGCSFDLDELSRACEILMMVLAMIEKLNAADKKRLLKGIKKADLTKALAKSYDLVKDTTEYRKGSDNFTKYASWLEDALRKRNIQFEMHHIVGTGLDYINSKDQYFKPTYKISAPLSPPQTPAEEIPVRTFVHHPAAPATFTFSHTTVPNVGPPRRGTTDSTSSRNSTSNSSPPKTTFNNITPTFINTGSTPVNNTGRSYQPRFRYFNPRKSNKFMFIDEHPA